MLKYISTTTKTERERGKNTRSKRDLSIAYKICLKTLTNRATILRVRKREKTQISDRTAWIRIEREEGLLTCYHDEELGDQTAGNIRVSGEEEGERELKNGEEGSRR